MLKFNLAMKHLIITFLVLFLIGCTSKTTDNEFNMDEDDSLIFVQVSQTVPDLVEEVIGSIPPPIELTSLIQGIGANYTKNILNPTENVKNYNTNFKKALNLGIFAADLGYINLYEQNQDALLYLNSVKKLADDIRIGQYFNFETLRRLTNSGGNIDSLLYITTSNFENMYHHLRDNDRTVLAILMLTGSWLEALHIATQIDKQNADKKWHKELSERIGEQKITLDQIMILLSVYQNDHSIIKLTSKLEKLKELFESVELKYVYEEPTFKEVDGMLIVQDHSKTIIKMDEELLAKIISETESIRETLIN